MKNKLSLKKAFELGCLDLNCKRFLKPLTYQVAYGIEIEDGANLYLVKYQNQAIIKFISSEEFISLEEADELIELHKKERPDKDGLYLFEKEAKILKSKFGDKILG